LIYIIDEKVLVKFQADYEALISGRKKPYWWYAFVKEWRRCGSAEHHDEYHTDTNLFICSCPAWMKSKFFICKHICKDKQVPAYRQLRINRSPPFIQISATQDRLRADIDGEELPNFPIQEHVTSDPLPNLDDGQQGEQNCEGDLDDILSVVSNFEWFAAHTKRLYEEPGGRRQLQYIQRVCRVQRMIQYRTNVERSESQRRTPRTWDTADTTFLP